MGGFVLPVRVYLEDTDAQGVVYNASYFRFLERARTEWLRSRGVDHHELRDRHGVALVLAAIEARFRAPARLDDMLHVTAELDERRGARVVFAQRNHRGEAGGPLVGEAVAEVACMDVERGSPRRVTTILGDELKE